MMTNGKGSLIATIETEKQYRGKAEGLLNYLQKTYELK
jgi:hypothetical protein